MERKIKPETMWAIHGEYGFYVGTQLTRHQAIEEFTDNMGLTWDECRKKGDRAVKVTISPITRVTDEPVNQYTPWVELGISETQYYKRRYLEMSSENARLAEELEDTGLRTEIENWLKMLSTEIFQEPDFVKARALLEAGGMTLDGLSASNMRHVLTRLIEHDDKARAARVQAATLGDGTGGEA